MQEQKDGSITINEPIITQVSMAYNKKGVFNGYLFNGMYIPKDQNNNLCKIIETAIAKGECTIEDNAKTNSGDFLISELVNCIVFPDPWEIVKNSFGTTIDYPIDNKNMQPSNYSVQYINIETDLGQYPLKALDKYYHNTNGSIYPPDAILKKYFGILEIIIPVTKLKKLFFSIKKELNDFVIEKYEEHMRHTERAEKEGPDLEWLISYFPLYSEPIIIDISNRAIETFLLYSLNGELKYVSEKSIHKQWYIYSRSATENVRLMWSSNSIQPYSGLSGYDTDHQYSRLANNNLDEYEKAKAFYETSPISHIRKLVDNGLTLEAVCLVNAYLEVTFKRLLIMCILRDKTNCDSFDEGKIEIINSWGHRRNLNLLYEIIINDHAHSAVYEQYGDYIKSAKQIYKHRNDYIHDLEAINMPIMTHSVRKNLEHCMECFYKFHDADIFVRSQWRFINDCSEKQIKIIDDMINKYIARRALKNMK